MELIKKIFPLSFSPKLVMSIIIYVFAGAIFGVAGFIANTLVGWIPVIGGLVGLVIKIVGGLIGTYSLVGIVLLILYFCDVIKD
jgi:hypothetical protein